MDEFRWAAKANTNYKFEALLKNAAFDLKIYIYDALVEQNGNRAKPFYVLEELRENRFWFGAGRSKGSVGAD
ncbi:MAG: hypothetical protein ONB37_08945 [candidate division KSB1 bacterium]|nr:hypothetical protein [candidate division KSB1 bacterium]